MVYRGKSLARKDDSITFEIPMDLEETQEYSLDEMEVRMRLSDIEIARLAQVLGLDFKDIDSWSVLEQLTAGGWHKIAGVGQ